MIRQKLQKPTFIEHILKSYYNLNGVNLKRADNRYWKSLAEEDELRQKQLEFAEELGTIIVQRVYQEIVYIDETTFHLWQKMSKAWVRPGMKL